MYVMSNNNDTGQPADLCHCCSLPIRYTYVAMLASFTHIKTSTHSVEEFKNEVTELLKQ